MDVRRVVHLATAAAMAVGLLGLPAPQDSMAKTIYKKVIKYRSTQPVRIVESPAMVERVVEKPIVVRRNGKRKVVWQRRIVQRPVVVERTYNKPVMIKQTFKIETKDLDD